MHRILCFAMIALILCQTATARATDERAKRFYIVDAAIYETEPSHSSNEVRILASPKLAVCENKEANVVVGEEVPIGDIKVHRGTSMSITARPAKRGKIQLCGILDVSSVDSPSEDIVVRESTAVHFAKIVTDGEKTRFNISESSDGHRWFELRISEYKSEARPQEGKAASPDRTPADVR
jgi:hypothetical protein